MNTLYKGSKASLPFEITVVKLFFAFARLALVLLVLGFAVAKASAQELVSPNLNLSPGTSVQNGATYKPVNVVAGTDALVKLNDQPARKLPVNLTGFSVSMINKKISVNWSTSTEKNASHFVVQRGTDRVEFTDAGIIFTDGNYTDSRSYSFKDPISTNGKDVLYYRLKMVDMDGQFALSATRTVKLKEAEGKLELQTFPNPVVNELRITIPGSWQSKQVVYELYGGDGQLVKRFLSKSATQTEIIDMQNYEPGMYVVKALMESEVASQWIIKTR